MASVMWDMWESILAFSGKKDQDGENTAEKGESQSQEDINRSTSTKEEKEERNVLKADTIKNPGCLHHGAKYRCTFQQLVNMLRSKPDLMPTNYAQRLGKVVCICNTSTDTSTVKFEEDHLKRLTASLARHYYGYDQMDMKAVLQKLLTPGSTNISVFKLHAVLTDAGKGIFSKLECPKPKVAPKTGDNDKENATPAKIKEAVTLPLPNEYISHLIGKKGVHVNALTSGYGVELSVVSPCSLRRVPYTAPKGPNVIVELTASTQDEIDAAKTGIIAKSKAIVLKREKHKRNMELHSEWLRKRWEQKRKLREERRKHGNNFSDVMYGTDTDGGYLKHLDRESHVSKYKQHRKTGNTLRSKPAPVLEGSTCINCLGHYDAATKNTTESCRFHPGYLLEASASVEFRWQGCRQVARITRAEMMSTYYLDLTNEPSSKKAVENMTYMIHKKSCIGCNYKKNGRHPVTYSDEKLRFWSCCKKTAGNSASDNKKDKHELHAENGQ